MTPRAYPLQWPAGWPKTPEHGRSRSTFRTELNTALKNLRRQLELMGGRGLVLSSNASLGDSRPKDVGVCAYFEWCAEPHKPPQQWLSMAIPCDRWDTIEGNVQAIALTVEAMRGMERWGAKNMIKAMFTGFKALPAATRAWWEVLGLEATEPLEGIKVRYRNLVKIHHPDNGGDPDRFREIQQAYEFALERGA